MGEELYYVSPELAAHLMGIRTQEDVDAVNQANKNRAKGLFKGMLNGSIAPSLSNIGNMVSSAYHYYIAPETNAITGIAPSAGLRVVRPTRAIALKNPINNQAEMNAYKDYLEYLKELKAAGKPVPREIVPSVKPTGRLPYGLNTRYPDNVLLLIKAEQAALLAALLSATTKIKVKSGTTVEGTTRKADLENGINTKTRTSYQNQAALTTGDMRHAQGAVGRSRVRESSYRSIQSGLEEGRISGKSKYPSQFQKEYNKLSKKMAMKPQNAAEYRKQLRELYKSIIAAGFNYKLGGTLK